LCFCVVVLFAGEGLQSAADNVGSKVGSAVDSVKGLASEAADTARATGEPDGFFWCLLFCSGTEADGFLWCLLLKWYCWH
jgi:hypothetical protein